MKHELPTDYTQLDWKTRREVREQYIEEQGGKCFYCGCDLNGKPDEEVLNKNVNWGLFPDNFLRYPIHLQHNHDTGMTEGAVHAYCNAVMWQYEGR